MFIKKIIFSLIKIYKYLISPMLGDVCKFHPTCSQYMIDAINKHGVFKGLFLGVYRLIRCNPFSKGGVDKIQNSKINNSK